MVAVVVFELEAVLVTAPESTDPDTETVALAAEVPVAASGASNFTAASWRMFSTSPLDRWISAPEGGAGGDSGNSKGSFVSRGFLSVSFPGERNSLVSRF